MNVMDFLNSLTGSPMGSGAGGTGPQMSNMGPGGPVAHLPQQAPPVNPGMTGMDGLTQNAPSVTSVEPPKPPNPYATPKDMSGFANYGMEPPSLPAPDPMSMLKNLMAMTAEQQPRQQQQMQGNLMKYLAQLGGGA